MEKKIRSWTEIVDDGSNAALAVCYKEFQGSEEDRAHILATIANRLLYVAGALRKEVKK